MTEMDVETPTNITDQTSTTQVDPSPVIKPAWTNGTHVLALSDEIFQRLQDHKHISQEAGDLDDDSLKYEKPNAFIKSPPCISQRIRFNLIRHRSTHSDIPTIKLFKSFAATLRNADSSIIFLPFQMAKQHNSSQTNIKQIQSIDQSHFL